MEPHTSPIEILSSQVEKFEEQSNIGAKYLRQSDSSANGPMIGATAILKVIFGLFIAAANEH